MDEQPQKRRISRKGLLGLCDRLSGVDGRAVYHDGRVLLEAEGGETVAVLPPFPLEHEASYDRVETGPLVEALERPRVVGLLGVRLGGYGAAVYRDEHLVAGRGGSRFVKNRNKKGGSSSNRFRRRREEQERALLDAAAETAARVFEPYRERIEHVALGGDRAAAEKVAERLPWLADKRLERFFTVPEPRLRELERLPYELYAAELSEER